MCDLSFSMLACILTWFSGNVEVWKCGNVEMGNVEIEKCGNGEMWKWGNVEVWKCRNVEE